MVGTSPSSVQPTDEDEGGKGVGAQRAAPPPPAACLEQGTHLDSYENEPYSPYDTRYRVKVSVWREGGGGELRRATLRRYFVLRDGQSVGQGWRRVKEADPVRDEINRDRAIRRAKSLLRDAIIATGGQRMWTMTFRDNVTDLTIARGAFNRWVRLMQARFPRFSWTASHERQERGAWHFHVSVNGSYPLKVCLPLWYRAIGGTGHETGTDTPGGIDIGRRKKRWGGETASWRPWKIAAYMGKYMAKTWAELPKGSKHFTASGNRDKARSWTFWVDGAKLDEVMQRAYFAAAGDRAVGVEVWLSQDGAYGSITVTGPPGHQACPF